MYDWYKDPVYVYIGFEMCQGGNLAEMIQSEKVIREKQAAEITHQILCVLDYYACLGRAFGDLTPNRVFFNGLKGAGTVKLPNFELGNLLFEMAKHPPDQRLEMVE